MTRALLAVFVAVELADLLTYLQAPALEANPLMQGSWTPVAKVAGVTLAVLIALRIRTDWLRAVALGVGIAIGALGVGIAIGALGVGANLATLSMVHAAEAPRPVQEPAPIAPAATGYELAAVPAAAPGRTAAPVAAPVPSPAVTAAERPAAARGSSPSEPAHRLSGTASWYATPGLTAAAGPALRRWLGRGWRGARVRVTAGGRSVVVVLADWCRCTGDFRERAIDLSDDAFVELAPLAAGVVRVRIEPFRLPATDR